MHATFVPDFVFMGGGGGSSIGELGHLSLVCAAS